MSERTTIRPAAADDDLVFHDYHRPAVLASDYTLTIGQTLTARAGASVSGSGSLRLRVGGPQLDLPADSLVSTFPADTSSGRYFTALPHVTLSRGVLPWERDARAVPDRDDPRTWLVVLVLSDEEFAAATLQTVARTVVPAGIPTGDSSLDQVPLLSVSPEIVRSHFPPSGDLPWLAHVRSIAPAGGEPGPETATVLSSRLAVRGALNHAFLLSLEHRYADDTIDVGTDPMVSFPVLHRWTFFCEDEHPHGFVELLTRRDGARVDPTLLTLPDDPSSPDITRRTRAGFVPVRHEDRTGATKPAWFHGPLLPAPAPVAVDVVADNLPADRSDQLLLTDDELGMADLSYAAAWELGRLLTLEHTDIATDLFHWKRSFAHVQHRAGRASGVATVPGDSTWARTPAMPTKVAQWLRHSILELREVPFRYLVPDEAMLPTPGLRFFDVDPLWVECLRDGAISVGRTDSRARELEVDLREHLGAVAPMSGLLLRSGAVSDFPQLEVDGYDRRPSSTFAGPSLPIRRMQRLAPSVLLVLFDGQVTTADIHLHPQAVHFGFDLSATSTPEREILTKGSVEIGQVDAAPAPLVAMNPSRRIDMAHLASMLGVTSAVGQGGVAEFAARMLDGVPLVRFERVLGAT